MCVIGAPSNCITLEDQYGPYETEFNCKQRALAISRQINKHYPLWKPYKYKCTKLSVGRLIYDKENK